MLKTKYIFLKRIYPNSVIIFLVKRKYHVLYKDLNITQYFIKNNLFKDLNNLHVNYILLDNLDIIANTTFKDNKYDALFIKGLIIEKIKQYNKHNIEK